MIKKKIFKNILIVRTDRIGDVVLTTPAIQALREACPSAKISILVAPQTKSIVQGNPYLDQVIVYDFKGKDRGFFGFWRFTFKLMRMNFDLAINYHVKNRTNALLFFSGIPLRVGFKNKKLGFFLNKTILDTRVMGAKHESEYCLDLIKSLGMDIDKKYSIYASIDNESEKWTDKLLTEYNIADEKLVAIHPGASCISKRWPPILFSQVIDQIVLNYKIKVIVIGAGDNQLIAEEVIAGCKSSIIDFTGKTSVSHLISLLKRCSLLISNDSGPVHLAAGVGTPVVSIFGRNQPGLSVMRWRSLGYKDISLHKDVGCKECLAHNCQIGFQCLKAIEVRDVVNAANRILNS